MRIKFTLRPVSRRTILPVSYNYFLTSLIYAIINASSNDYSCFLHDEGYKLQDSRKGFKLFTYSMLMSDDAKVAGDKIVFGNSSVHWQVSSPVDEFIQHLITGVFAEEIIIGSNRFIKDSSNSLNRSNSSNSSNGLNDSPRFIIERVETLPMPEFKNTMRFTCLSPITVSKTTGSSSVSRSNNSNSLNGLSGLSRLSCHYIRPWEDGFSEAIKNNLSKKYKLVHGKDITSTEFSIKIDTDYMNRKSGKITKNINFKGTNIIGFMAPFEVSGNPELIRIGYEAGFGEKGSMGFGLVREADNGLGVNRLNRSSSSNGSA